MKSNFFVWFGLLAGQFSQPLWAQANLGQQESMQWLQRVAGAAQKLSYSGTFVYRNGSHSETSRVVHINANGNQMEKLEVLDGSPREVIRLNDEVKCYLPDSRLMIVEQRSSRRTFPALLPVGLAGLSDYYLVRKGSRARIAGIDSQIIRLDPRDAWRFGHQFWIDPVTGLLLKAEMFNENGELLESLAFTELHIGEPASPDALKSSFAGNTNAKEPWLVRQVKMRDIRDDGQWLFRAELPGFRRQAAMLRGIPESAGAEAHEMLHWIYSDGLAALSVFISPLQGQRESVAVGAQSLGAISVLKRVVAGHLVVVMGDVPPAAINHFAAGIEVQKK
jgi:sigma-E factor negative regulatory protein RseB